jgi:hypothetical protein
VLQPAEARQARPGLRVDGEQPQEELRHLREAQGLVRRQLNKIVKHKGAKLYTFALAQSKAFKG